MKNSLACPKRWIQILSSAVLSASVIFAGPSPAVQAAATQSPAQIISNSKDLVRYFSFGDKDQGQPIRVHAVEVKLSDPRVQLDLAMAKEGANAVERVSHIARRHGALAAINGSFFHGTTLDSSVGLVVRQGEIIADSGHRRTSLGIDPQGKMIMGIPQVRTGLFVHQQDRFQRVNGVNQPRKYHQTVVYTPRFGQYTRTNTYGREVVVRDNRVVRYSYGNTQIPRDGFVISAHGKGKDIQDLYPLGSEISLKTIQQGAWKQVNTILTGAPHLVKEGRVHNTYFQERLHSSLKKPNSRSAIGYTHNGKLLMVTVLPAKGNKGGGVTFTRLAQIMRRMGAYEAMALDGGGSTSIYVPHTIEYAHRPVTNALIIKPVNS